MSATPPPVVRRGMRARTHISPPELGPGDHAEHVVEVHNFGSTACDVDVRGDCDAAGPLRYAPGMTSNWRPNSLRLNKPNFLGNQPLVRFAENVHFPSGAARRQADERVNVEVATRLVAPTAELAPLAAIPLIVKCRS